jgi:uncharacterized membrane protein
VKVATVARIVVVADFLFTATTVVAQPITGVALAWHVSYSLTEGRIVLSVLPYVVTGCFWLPVVRMHLAEEAASKGLPLHPIYHRLFWTWFVFGFPALPPSWEFCG